MTRSVIRSRGCLECDQSGTTVLDLSTHPFTAIQTYGTFGPVTADPTVGGRPEVSTAGDLRSQVVRGRETRAQREGPGDPHSGRGRESRAAGKRPVTSESQFGRSSLPDAFPRKRDLYDILDVRGPRR